VSGPASSTSVRSSGASVLRECSAGVSWTAAGCSSSTSGLVVCEKAPTVAIVVRAWRRNAGKARTVAASDRSRAAVVANRACELRTNPCSWVGDLASAENTVPESDSSVRVAAPWRWRTVSTAPTFWVKG
jgi:hypothetical protein